VQVGVHNYAPCDLHDTVPFIIKAWEQHRDAFEASGLGESAPRFSLASIADAVGKAKQGALGRVLLVPK
jgi:hypothetical protein